ncbi:hypothetical protein OROHE_000180 [Orobanche hederae]
MGEFKNILAMNFNDNELNSVGKDEYSELHKVVRDAFFVGKKWMEDLKRGIRGIAVGSVVKVESRGLMTKLDKLFVLTLITGLEGYHINVDGRHVLSFPNRLWVSQLRMPPTGLFLNLSIDVHSIITAALPTSHPSTAPRKHLEMSIKWKAPRLPTEPVDLFIGILSAGNHFAERMAHGRKEVNV